MVFVSLQTTYENFRYRYDKKENPYNGGTVKNLREVFFSKVPSSMNKFRSFVEKNEPIMVLSMMANLGEAIICPKEKIDIEMGTKCTEGSGFSLPEILRNLDYDDLEDNMMKSVEEEGIPAFDLGLPGEQELKQFVQSSPIGDGVRMSSQQSSAGDGAGECDRSSMATNATKVVKRTDDGNNLHPSTAPVFQA